MSRQGFNHALFYRFGVVAIFLFFMGFMIFVVFKAQTRRSGNTGIDADKMNEIRLESQVKPVSE